MIWAVQNGYVDDVPVERIKEFQAGWTEFLTTRKADLLTKIARGEGVEQGADRRAQSGRRSVQADVEEVGIRSES